VLAIAMSGDDPRLMDALCRGADGYFALSRFADTLPEAVAQVLRGESTMSPQLARRVARRLEAEGLASTGIAAGAQQPLGLDEGERQVLHRIGEGYLPGEVAVALQQSPHAVGRAIRGIYRKLQFLQQARHFSLAA
jgi:DNA-binding NarL/FixJ family response regulator